MDLTSNSEWYLIKVDQSFYYQDKDVIFYKMLTIDTP